MLENVRKLVLPVGGLGKRLRPLTLRTPKALVRLNDIPIVEYMLYEAAASGIREVILVVNPQHQPHFQKYIRNIRSKFPQLKFHLRRQEKPMGNGHAILQAADVVGQEPFAVRFCDDIIPAEPPILASLLALYRHYHAPIMLLERVPPRAVSRYGVVGVKPVTKPSYLPPGKVYRVNEFIEKPKLEQAPSNLIVIGGYIITAHIMRNLTKIVNSLPVAGNDALPLAVAFQVELIVGGKLYGWEFSGTRLDCGTIEALKMAETMLAKNSPNRDDLPVGR